MGVTPHQEESWDEKRQRVKIERRKDVLRLHHEGLRPVAIAKILGCSESTVSLDLQAMGFETSRQAETRRRREEVKKLWEEEGLYNATTIAARVRASKSVVLKDLRELGLVADRKRAQPKSHINQRSVVEDILSMLRASTVTLEQYDFKAVTGREDWVPDHATLKLWRRDINAFLRQIRQVQTMITEIQKESMR